MGSLSQKAKSSVSGLLTGIAKNAYIHKYITSLSLNVDQVLAMQNMYSADRDEGRSPLRGSFYDLALRCMPKINRIRGKRKAHIQLNSVWC